MDRDTAGRYTSPVVSVKDHSLIYLQNHREECCTCYLVIVSCERPSTIVSFGCGWQDLIANSGYATESTLASVQESDEGKFNSQFDNGSD